MVQPGSRPAPGSVMTIAGGWERRSWSDRLHAWRDRLFISHRFRRFAARFPLTRPIARKRAKALFDLCTGFVHSQVLLACVRLRLFEHLREAPQTLDDLARSLDLPRDTAERLLLAACSLELVARRGEERFGLGEQGAAFLGSPGLDLMVEHHAMLYRDLADPVALLRGEVDGTALQRYWAYAGTERASELGGAAVADYSQLMAATLPMIAADILDAYPVDRHRCLMDVGGGEGAFLEAVAACAPDLELRLFDLPAVVERARQRFEARGLAGRLEVHGGDVHSDALPKVADLVTLVRIIHDHDDEAALGILKAVRRALPPGGTLLLAEPMAGMPGTEAMAAAYFGFYFLAMGRGRVRSVDQLAGMLRAAGYAAIEPLPTRIPLLVSMIKATVNNA